MAARKPIVLVNGEFEQLQAGDTLEAPVSEVDLVSKTSDNAGSIILGQVVYAKTNGAIDLARANASGTLLGTFGFVKDASIASAASGNIQTDGVLTCTTGEWDAVTGDTGGLTVGSKYYVDAAVAGRITDTPPTGAGEFVKQVGLALSTTELEISFGPSTKL